MRPLRRDVESLPARCCAHRRGVLAHACIVAVERLHCASDLATASSTGGRK